MRDRHPSGFGAAVSRVGDSGRSKPLFDRTRLPRPDDYYTTEGIVLRGCGSWRDAVCPFHKDTHPSLRVFHVTGAFRCMVCGAHGGDVLAFHMLRHHLRFIDAAKALGAWGAGR